MSGDEPTELSDLIGGLYDAALEPDRWPRVLERTVAVFGGEMGALLLFDGRHPAAVGAYLHGVEPSLARASVARAEQADWWSDGAQAAPLKVVPRASSRQPRQDLGGAILCRELAKRTEAEHVLGGVVIDPSPLKVCLSVIRRSGGPVFDPRAEAMMQALLPHLAKAHVIHRRHRALDAAHHALEPLFERARHGVLIVDRQARQTWANDAATRILAAGDGLRLHRGRVRPSDPAQQRPLDAMIEAACRAGLGAGPAAGSGLAIDRPSGRLPLQLIVAPLSGRHGGTGRIADGCCVLFLHDPTRPDAIPIDVLTGFYGLTRAEARLCSALSGGATMAEICVRLRISQNTAKTHLKRVFAKCGVRSQAELLQLFARGLR